MLQIGSARGQENLEQGPPGPCQGHKMLCYVMLWTRYKPWCFNHGELGVVFHNNKILSGLPRWLTGRESSCQRGRHRRCGLDPGGRKIPWSRSWQPPPVLLLENSVDGGARQTRVRGQTRLRQTECTRAQWVHTCTGMLVVPFGGRNIPFPSLLTE